MSNCFHRCFVVGAKQWSNQKRFPAGSSTLPGHGSASRPNFILTEDIETEHRRLIRDLMLLLPDGPKIRGTATTFACLFFLLESTRPECTPFTLATTAHDLRCS